MLDWIVVGKSDLFMLRGGCSERFHTESWGNFDVYSFFTQDSQEVGFWTESSKLKMMFELRVK